MMFCGLGSELDLPIFLFLQTGAVDILMVEHIIYILLVLSLSGNSPVM